MPKFHAISFNTQHDVVAASVPETLSVPGELHGFLHDPTGAASGAMGGDPELEARASETTAAWSMETAARSHLQTLLENQGSERLAAITSPDNPALVPDLTMESAREQPLTGNQTVRFQQTARSIPIFGSRATVDIDGASRKLVSVDGSLADIPELSPLAALSPLQAAEALARYGNADPAAITPVQAPLLNYYLDREGAEGDDAGTWRLVYVFRGVPMVPPGEAEATGDGAEPPPAMHCCGPAFPWTTPEFHYLVDANSGEVVLQYSAVAYLDVPVPCDGEDVDGVTRKFFCRQTAAGVEMVDPLRNIITYDHGFGDISGGAAFPPAPVSNPGPNFGKAAPAAVSAHCFAGQVFDFYNHVLKRQGVDDKGMKLESVVNCYSSSQNPDPSPVWRNAMWSRNRMWYGQMPGSNGGGGPVSTARHFDVIAHELTHGITEHTASLVYRKESGALNESFSDIFGVIVKNWYPGEPNPLSGWDWSIGKGWNSPTTVLRSMEDPTLGQPIWPAGNGQPAHMSQFVITNRDAGGVHINSGIHNKAAYNVLTATDAAGDPVFTPGDVAILYYLALTRLGALATFSDCRRVLLNVATTYFSSSPTQQQKLQAITQAYDAVGIP